jgi:hypothetical protein
LPPSQTGSRRDGAAKLPLWDTIHLSYSSYFENFSDVLRISWLWLAAVTPLWGAVIWLSFSLKANLAAGMKGGTPPSVETTMLTPLVILVFTFAGASIAVAWHRRLILGEPPGFSGSNVATKGLWRYVGIGFAIALIAFLPLLVVVLPIFILLSSVITGAVLRVAMFAAAVFLIYLTAFAVFLRLSLLLPARAVGDLDLTFNETWKRTRGNTWRMLWGFVACTVPPMLAAQVAVRIASFVSFGLGPGTSDGSVSSPGMSEAGAIVGTASFAILIVCQLLTLPIGFGFLSYSYRYFFGRT